MSDDKEKLLRVMRSLDEDYRHGKISEDKYRYFRSKYEDKLNTLDARDATNRIRSMQGKPSDKNISQPPRLNKKKDNEQDLVQKYIINPKKGDKDLNKEKKAPMETSTFNLVLVLVLVIGFTAGIGFGVFTFDFGSISVSDTQAIVEDTAFPEVQNISVNNTNNTNNTSVSTGDTYTSDNSYSSKDTSSSKYSSSSSDYSSSDSGSSSSSDYSGSSSSGSADSGSSSSQSSSGGANQ